MNDNRVVLSGKPYLKNNFSNFEHIHFPSKQPFLTSNKRDFKEQELYEQCKSHVKKNKSSFVNASHIVLGESSVQTSSTYRNIHNNPSDQISRFNYEKIKFKNPEYRIDPLTATEVGVNLHNNWGFEYFKNEKPKRYVSNDKNMMEDRKYNKIFDPITNRYIN